MENILSRFTLHVGELKSEVYSLFNKSKKHNHYKEIETSILELIDIAKMLSKQFDDKITD